jgi:hypothetical protein
MQFEFIKEQLEAVTKRLEELQPSYDEYVKLSGVKVALAIADADTSVPPPAIDARKTAAAAPVAAGSPAPKRRGRPPKNPAAQA